MCRSLFCALCIFCAATAGEEAAVKVIIPEEERNELPQIEADSSNIRVEPFSDDREFQPIPEDSFASALGMPGKNIRWTPAKDPDMIHKLRICGSGGSFDKSVLFLAETTGKKDGPYGTRILLFSTTNLLILRYIDLPCIAKEIRCEGSSGRLWFLREPQPEFLNDTPAVCILDAKSGKIIREIPVKSLPERLYPHVTGKFAWILRGDQILRLYPDGKEQVFLKEKDCRDLIFSPDCNYFCIKTKDSLKLYTSQRARQIGVYDHVPGKTFRFLAGNPPALLVGKNETAIRNMDWPENVYFCSGKNSSRHLTELISGPVVMDIDGMVFYALKPKNRLEKINALNGKLLGFSNFKSIKPVVPGNILYFFPTHEPDHFLIFDSVGGLSKIDTSMKRWKRVESVRPWTE